MKRRIVVAVVLAVLMAASAHAQTTDFLELVKTGTPQSVRAAIGKGADVKARNNVGATPLVFAVWYNQNPEVITTLLGAGADVEAQDVVGKTVLMYAAQFNQNPEVITTLLKAGAEAKAKDKRGLTAFDYAQGNADLKGTDAYWKLSEAQY